MNPINFIKSNEWARYVVVLLIGAAIGAVFYPTKQIEEKVSKKYEQDIATLNQQHQETISKMTSDFNSQSKSMSEQKVQSDLKITQLQTQITTLKSHQKTSHYKLIKPDGTIEERDYTDTDINQSSKTVTSIQQEFTQKIDSIEKKWEAIHLSKVQSLKTEFDSKETTYKKTISDLESSKSVSINPKHYGVEAGYLTGNSYYVHGDADIFGPVFVGIQGQTGNSNAIGVGLGLRL
jgi:hypothetical protein